MWDFFEKSKPCPNCVSHSRRIKSRSPRQIWYRMIFGRDFKHKLNFIKWRWFLFKGVPYSFQIRRSRPKVIVHMIRHDILLVSALISRISCFVSVVQRWCSLGTTCIYHTMWFLDSIWDLAMKYHIICFPTSTEDGLF